MTIKKLLIPVLLTPIFLLAVAYCLFLISKSRTFQFSGELINRVNTKDKVVALTFDDAPTGFSDQVVDILQEKDVKATFYMIGQNIKDHPQQAQYIADHGHELGNHSYSHHRFLLKSLSFIDHEIQTTNQLIRDLGYQGDITFRPPNCKKLFLLPWYLNRHNIKTVTWDVEPDTYVPGDAQAIVSLTLDHVSPGSIILLHPFCSDRCQADRDALPLIIDQLKSQGYSFVTVSQLLTHSAI